MTLIPVKNSKGLFRDSETGAIINNNTNDYQTYITNRDRLLSEKERIDKLENDIGDIKRMLQQLTNANNTITFNPDGSALKAVWSQFGHQY